MTPLRAKRLGMAALGLSFVTLAVIAGASYENWRKFREEAATVVHARNLLAANRDAIMHLRDAVATQRGFLLTGNPRYLERYHSAAAGAREDLDELVSVCGGDAPMGDLARQFRDSGRARLEQFAGGIEIRRTKGLAAALSDMESEHAEPVLETLMKLSDEIDARGTEERRDAWASLQEHARTTRWLTLFGAAALAGLVVAGTVALGKAATTQEALTASASRARDLLRTTFYSIGDAVIATDRNGAITMMNPVAERLTGYSEPDAAGRPAEEVFHVVKGATGKEVESPISRVLKSGKAIALATDSVLLSRSGRQTPIDDSGAPIRHEGGEIEGVVLVFRDVTEPKKAQEALRRSEERFRVVADSAPVMIWSETPDGERDYFNRTWLRYCGRPAEQEYGHGWKESIHPEELPRYLELRSESRRELRPYSVEYRLRRADGAYGWVHCRGIPRFGSQGEFLGYIGTCVDIDEARKAEEKMREAAKLESLGVLAGGIAHDFNNLLVGIMGSASLLEDYVPPGSPGREFLDSVQHASDRAARLIREMLAYSGQGRFVIESLDLSEQVRQIVTLVRASIPRNVQVRLNLSDRPVIVRADAAQLQQVIMNLVINAAEACSPEGGWVEIATSSERVERDSLVTPGGGDAPEPGEYVVLTVTDNGVGMDSETKSKIFDPFFTTKFTGRGLGLAAVSGIIRSHRGAARVESEPGRGTRFQVFLPGMGVPAGGRQESPARAAAANRKVLVVDDEEMVQRIARAALERAGYSVLTAGSFAEALDVCRNNAADISMVLLDVALPETSVEPVLRSLRELRPDLPIMVTSGYSEPEVRKRFGKAVDGYLAKPYTAKELASAVAGVLEDA